MNNKDIEKQKDLIFLQAKYECNGVNMSLEEYRELRRLKKWKLKFFEKQKKEKQNAISKS